MIKEYLQENPEKIETIKGFVRYVIENPDLQYAYLSFLDNEEYTTQNARYEGLTEISKVRVASVQERIETIPLNKRVVGHSLNEESTNSWLFTTSIPHLSEQQYADLRESFPQGIPRDAAHIVPMLSRLIVSGIFVFASESDFASSENLFDMSADSSFLVMWGLLQIGEELTSKQRATLLQASLTATLVVNKIYPENK